jgi:hypothetical protein
LFQISDILRWEVSAISGIEWSIRLSLIKSEIDSEKKLKSDDVEALEEHIEF